jgi:DNA end-binding protein Ku
MISIPVKLYLTAAAETFAFNQITPQDHKVKQRLVDEVTLEEVDKDKLRKGYEYEKGQFAIFTDEELDNLLDADKKGTIELVEFVKDKHFNPISIEKSYYLQPDVGSEKSYRLLHAAMQKLDKMVVGKYYARGKDNLIVIRATEDHLSLFVMYYANEVRKFEYQFSDAHVPSKQELTLAAELIKKLSSDTFDPGNYSDEFATRARAAIEVKKAGGKVTLIGKKSNYIGPVDLVTLMEASIKAPKKALKAK